MTSKNRSLVTVNWDNSGVTISNQGNFVTLSIRVILSISTRVANSVTISTGVILSLFQTGVIPSCESTTRYLLRSPWSLKYTKYLLLLINIIYYINYKYTSTLNRLYTGSIELC